VKPGNSIGRLGGCQAGSGRKRSCCRGFTLQEHCRPRGPEELRPAAPCCLRGRS
jgi:hypothetical protein